MRPENAGKPARRDFLKRSTLLAGGSLATSGLFSSLLASEKQPAEPERPKRQPRVASINSIYRLKSHAYHIAGRFIFGYKREGFHHQPNFRLSRMFNHQYPENDLSHAVGKLHGVEVSPTVAAALGGESGLDVDAVLLIIEHGDYPLNEYEQVLYPRYEHFEQVVEVFRKSERTAPVFVDNHLSYDHRQAHAMVKTAKEMGFGLMAGSSLPVTWRRPELEPPLETPIKESLVAFGYDRGPAEIYLFHALETLQSMVERRQGGESGVRQVRCFRGPQVWEAGDRGLWSWSLLRAALARAPSMNYGDVRENVPDPIVILIDYRDGTRATVIDLPEQISDFNFAASVDGLESPIACSFYLPPPPGARFFDPLVANIEKFFASGRPPYPVERTLLTSTVLDFAMHSLKADGSPQESPFLDVRYKAPSDSGFFRGRYTDAG